MSNYPPGVTGCEPQITGDPAWEAWCDSLQPGDRCTVSWQVTEWQARVVRVLEDGLVVNLNEDDPHGPAVVVGWEDVEPPEECR